MTVRNGDFEKNREGFGYVFKLSCTVKVELIVGLVIYCVMPN